MKSEYLFQTFFGSQDEDCPFAAEGQRLATQVLQIFKHQSPNTAKSFSPTHQVTENDVKSIKTKFNKISDLIEDAKEALMAIRMEEDHGICTEDAGIPEVTSRTNGIWDLIGIFVKASIGVALLDACWSPPLAGAIRALVIGGSAIAAAVAAWRLSSDDDHRNDCSGDEWNFRGAFVTYVQVIGGFIILLALIHPIAVLSGIITLVFFGLLTFFGGITLWEIYFGNHLSESEEEDIFTLKDNFIEKLELTSWFESANQLSSAIEDATGHIVYVQSLNVAYALLSKVRETITFEEWLNKYLNSANSFCKLIERKYGSTLAPVVIAFVLVVLIFDDCNRSLMDSVFKSRHFEKSIKPELGAKIFRSNFVSLVADLNTMQKKISKNFDEGLETSHPSIVIAPIALDVRENNCNAPEELIRNECDRNLMEFTKQDGLITMPSSIDVEKTNTDADDQKYESKSAVKSEISDKTRESTTLTIECQLNDIGKNSRKVNNSELQIKNPFAYNQHKVRPKLQNYYNIAFVGSEPDLNINCGHTVLQNEADKNKTSVQKENSNSPVEEFNSIKELLPNPDKKFQVNLESQNIPEVIGKDEKMTILEELEKRVESLLNEGKTTKNQWLVDLEERFVKIFS